MDHSQFEGQRFEDTGLSSDRKCLKSRCVKVNSRTVSSTHPLSLLNLIYRISRRICAGIDICKNNFINTFCEIRSVTCTTEREESVCILTSKPTRPSSILKRVGSMVWCLVLCCCVWGAGGLGSAQDLAPGSCLGFSGQGFRGCVVPPEPQPRDYPTGVPHLQGTPPP